MKRPRHDKSPPSATRRVWEAHKLALAFPDAILAHRWVAIASVAYKAVRGIRGVG